MILQKTLTEICFPKFYLLCFLNFRIRVIFLYIFMKVKICIIYVLRYCFKFVKHIDNGEYIFYTIKTYYMSKKKTIKTY